MGNYKVVGPVEVGGVAPGKVVELDEQEVNVAALIEAGHIEPTRAKPSAEASKE